MIDRARADLLAWHWLRCPDVSFALIAAGLSPQDFMRIDLQPHRIAWAAHLAATRLCREGIPINVNVVVDLAVVELGQQYQAHSSSLALETELLIREAFARDISEFSPQYVLTPGGLVSEFIQELKVAPVIGQLTSTSSANARNLLLAQAQELIQKSDARGVVESPIFDKSARSKFAFSGVPIQTGVSWLDIPANGGHYAKAFCGILAESSGGKTMAGVQLVSEGVSRSRHQLGCYYEQSIDGDIASRYYSYLTALNRGSFQGCYSEYDSGTVAALDTITPQANKFLHLVDMSGNIPNQGMGGADELIETVRRYNESGIEIQHVLIDWLGVMVRRYANSPAGAKFARSMDTRQLCLMELDKLKLLTERYGANVTVLHQIAPGVIAGKSPAALLDWTCAEECKSFGELMNYVYVFSRRCPKTGCMFVNVPKARNAPTSHRVVQINGDSNRIDDVTDVMVLNKLGGTDTPFFVRKGEKAQMTRDAERERSVDAQLTSMF